jgi:hypothetical protein
MQKLIGNEVWIFLKKESINMNFGDIFGLMTDADDDSLYVQSFDKDNIKIYAVPRENVAFCTTHEPLQSERQVIVNSPTVPVETKTTPQQQQDPIIDRLNVYVNKLQVASLPIPPTFPVHEWNEKILRAIMGNPEVKQALAGKIQNSIEYYPGEVYISIDEVVPPSQMPEQPQDQNTFSMGGSPTTEYLNPSQMAQRLSQTGRGGK